MRAPRNAQALLSLFSVRVMLVSLLSLVVWAVLLVEHGVWKGGLIRVPIPLGGAEGLPVPCLYWLSIAGYAWAYGILFRLPRRERWLRAIRLGFGLHALVLIASLAWYLAGNAEVALSRSYLLYWKAIWAAALALGLAGFGWALAPWRRARTADPWLFFLPLVGGYLTLWISAATMPLPLTLAATAGGLALLGSVRVHRLRAWGGWLRDRLANERLFLSCVVLVAIALRLFYTSRIMSNPDFLNTGSDGPIYDALAWALAHGRPPPVESTPWWAVQFFSPGYVRFVALIYWLVGRSYFAVCAVQSVLGAAACVLIYAIAQRLFGQRVARLSAAFGAVNFSMVFAAASMGHQAMDLVWTLAVVWCLLTYLNDPARWGRWIVGIGLLLGWAAVTREGNIIFWFFLIGWFLLGMRAKLGWRRVLLHVSGLSLGFLVVLLPFLWEGGGEGGGGMVDRIAYIWFFYQHTATPINTWFNPWQNPEAAWTLFQGQPLTIVAKVGEAMLGNFTAMFLHQGYGSFDPVFLVRGSPYYDGMWFYALSLALVGLGVVCWGAFRRPREHVDWWLIIVLLASRTGVHLVLASAYRYRAPLEPYLIMLAAVGVTQLVHSLDANWAGGRRLRHATRPA